MFWVCFKQVPKFIFVCLHVFNETIMSLIVTLKILIWGCPFEKNKHFIDCSKTDNNTTRLGIP